LPSFIFVVRSTENHPIATCFISLSFLFTIDLFGNLAVKRISQCIQKNVAH
jgi:hypothetical protein